MLHKTLDLLDKIAEVLAEHNAEKVKISLPYPLYQQTLRELSEHSLYAPKSEARDVDWFRYHTPSGTVTVVSHD